MPRRLREHLHWPLLLLPFALAAVVLHFVELVPEVDRRFFFSGGSEALRDTRRIEDLFGAAARLVIVAEGDVGSSEYRRAVERLGDRLSALPSVLAVRSIAHGPDGLADARESPLWRRLLVGGGSESTRLVLVVEAGAPGALVKRVEREVAASEGAGFRLQLSGYPFAVERIRRHLERDFRRFGLLTLAIFGLASGLVFRSLRLALGALAACSSAVALTLLVHGALGLGIGLLTANLTTIVFVLAQSHVFFLGWNARQLGAPAEDLAAAARRITFRPSLWSMLTTLLGFASLLLVEAKPLRALGIGGVVGTVCAMACAYAIFPAFLRWDARAAPRREHALRPPRAGGRPFTAGAVATGAVALGVAALGLPRLDTDPSLLAYFDEESAIHRGLERLDRSVGSSPLRIAVAPRGGGPIEGEDTFRRLGGLHRALESDPAVGTVLGLPVLLAEADRFPLAGWLPEGWVVEALQSPLFERAAASFLTRDRRLTLFVLGMQESGREESRSRVLERLRRTVREHGFEARLTGGVYRLHEALSRVVLSSLTTGLLALLGAFAAVAWIAAGSLRLALAMLACMAAVPAVALGGLGLARLPLDVIAAPAANVALGLAADALFHLVGAFRRARAAGAEGWEAWGRARLEQWRGVASALGVVAAGFALFGLSSFPPTRRFGLAVVLGTGIAAALALLVLPRLAELGRRR